MPSIFETIKSLLDSHGIPHKLIHHAPTRTSEESAYARGEDISIGGKALVIKVGEEFKIFVLSAALKMDSNNIKDHFGVKKIRFASAEELESLTGLVPGSVPPFGKPILPFELFIDDSIYNNEKIAFNAGSLTDSIVMSTSDYLRIVQGQRLKFGIF